MLGDSESIAIPQSSNYAKEMRKWEAYPTKYGPPGRPFRHSEYPKMLYTCTFTKERGIQPVDRFVVNDETEERNMNSRGYLPLQQAYVAAEKRQTEEAKLAAEREYMIRHGRHSDGAIREIRAAEAEAGAVHLPDVPETPKARRGRKVTVAHA